LTACSVKIDALGLGDGAKATVGKSHDRSNRHLVLRHAGYDRPGNQVILRPILRRFAGAGTGCAAGAGAAAFLPKPLAFASWERAAA
jgi:hypothetical protein